MIFPFFFFFIRSLIKRVFICPCHASTWAKWLVREKLCAHFYVVEILRERTKNWKIIHRRLLLMCQYDTHIHISSAFCFHFFCFASIVRHRESTAAIRNWFANGIVIKANFCRNNVDNEFFPTANFCHYESKRLRHINTWYFNFYKLRKKIIVGKTLNKFILKSVMRFKRRSDFRPEKRKMNKTKAIKIAKRQRHEKEILQCWCWTIMKYKWTNINSQHQIIDHLHSNQI